MTPYHWASLAVLAVVGWLITALLLELDIRDEWRASDDLDDWLADLDPHDAATFARDDWGRPVIGLGQRRVEGYILRDPETGWRICYLVDMSDLDRLPTYKES